MKAKRILLIAVLILFSVTCIHLLNDSYDRLARYQYTVSSEQRAIMEEKLSDEDINYIIQQHIKPEQFMDFINLEGFNVKNTLYYECCRLVRPNDLQQIVTFVNTYRKQFSSTSMLENLITNYDYSMLSEFYDGNYPYIKDAKLIENPSQIDVKIGKKETLYRYIPNDLVMVDSSIIPIASALNTGVIEVKDELIEPLTQLCSDISSTNQKTCGGLILTKGYISYEDQNTLYDQAIVKYGVDEFQKYEDYPGQSEHQMGYTITFTIAEMQESEIGESEPSKWLLENAKKYGFIVRYPKDKENTTGKNYQPLTLRYVGTKALEEDNNILDQIFNN